MEQRKPKRKIIPILLLAVLALVAIFSILPKGVSKTSQSSVGTDSPLFSDVDTSLGSPQGASTTSGSHWSLDSTEDKMTSKKTYYYSVEAKELLSFDFPYNGGSIATLAVRKKRNDTDVYISVTKGQFHGDYDNPRVKIRFDDKPMKTYSYSEASAGSSNIIFLNNENDIISKLRTSKTMIIEAEFYSEGFRQMEFDVSGFQWNK